MVALMSPLEPLASTCGARTRSVSKESGRSFSGEDDANKYDEKLRCGVLAVADQDSSVLKWLVYLPKA
jgi:hypothetical protein